MKRYVVAELRRVATPARPERLWKRFYYSKPATERGKLTAEAKGRWQKRLGGKWNWRP